MVYSASGYTILVLLTLTIYTATKSDCTLLFGLAYLEVFVNLEALPTDIVIRVLSHHIGLGLVSSSTELHILAATSVVAAIGLLARTKLVFFLYQPLL